MMTLINVFVVSDRLAAVTTTSHRYRRCYGYHRHRRSGGVGIGSEGQPPVFRESRREQSSDDHATGRLRRIWNFDLGRISGRREKVSESGES